MSLTRKETKMADGSVVIDTKLDNGGFKSGLSKLGSVASSALKASE